MTHADQATAARFTLSANDGDHAVMSDEQVRAWWAGRRARDRVEVAPIPFADLEKWSFAPETGNLVHDSGKFFGVEGLRVRDGGAPAWSQPIINQAEIGILGILVKEFDGVFHALMQAKFEPGNVNIRQVSPTVQATRSNYTRVHRGADTRYLEYFQDGPERGRILVDVLQSEQGDWFWRKHNRNIVVEVTGDVPVHDDHCWLTLGQIRRLLREDNQINMDARTVLACMPFDRPQVPASDAFTAALLRSYEGGPSLHTMQEIISWFTETKTRCERTAQLIPLADVERWSRDDEEIVDDDRANFRIIGVRVEADTREVGRWTQPVLATREKGLAVFLTREIDGVLHVLVQSRAEPGLLDVVEMAPTVQLPPNENAADAAAGEPFVKEVVAGAIGRTRHDVVLSEEGGRFYHAQTRYRIVDAGDDLPLDVPENFRWVTVGQLMDLVRHGHYLNIQARSLLACLHSLW